MLSVSQTGMTAQTLRAALLQLAEQGAAEAAGPLRAAAGELAGDSAAPAPHPALPEVGAGVSEELVVAVEDTAAAMGHPDPAVNALGSPRIALWFEIVSSGLLPEPGPERTHVGVGILVHHLDRAEIGERVTVRAQVEAVAGRRAVFTCSAAVGDRLVALGVHQRVLLEQR